MNIAMTKHEEAEAAFEEWWRDESLPYRDISAARDGFMAAYFRPLDHFGPIEGKVFMSLNMTDEQAKVIGTAILDCGLEPELALWCIIRERDELLKRFRHHHVAGSENIDRCEECGLDIRSAIHTRADANH